MLGDPCLIIGEREVVIGRAITEMVALLGIAGHMSRERMQATLWPSSDPALTTSRLRSLVYRARQLFGTGLVTSDPPSSIGLSQGVVVDYRVASDAALRVQQGRDPGPGGLVNLVRLFGTELLPAYSWEWLGPYQHAWSRCRLRALTACTREAIRIGDHETAITACEQVIQAEPFHEEAHYLLISELLREGCESTARKIYDRFYHLLADELGCLPRSSYQQVRAAALGQHLTSLGRLG